MQKYRIFILAGLIIAAIIFGSLSRNVSAQTGYQSITGQSGSTYDLSGGGITRPVKSGSSDPATCTAGKDMFINTAGTPTLKLCTVTNTWSQITGSGGGGTAILPYTQTITAQTSVSIAQTTHLQGTLAIPACLTNASPAVGVNCAWTRNASGDFVFSFSPAFTGVIEIGGFGGTPQAPYISTITAQTTVTITGATHGKGVTPLAVCKTNASPAVAVACAWTNNGSGDLVFAFSPAFSGTIEVRQ